MCDYFRFYYYPGRLLPSIWPWWWRNCVVINYSQKEWIRVFTLQNTKNRRPFKFRVKLKAAWNSRDTYWNNSCFSTFDMRIKSWNKFNLTDLAIKTYQYSCVLVLTHSRCKVYAWTNVCFVSKAWIVFKPNSKLLFCYF